MTDRRFIEDSFPVKEVSAISAREKNIRHGHISTLHIWWARRPLASSRATAYAALTPPPGPLPSPARQERGGGWGEDFDPLAWQRRRDFIVELSRWENSLNQPILEKARRDILEAHAQRLSAERGEPVTTEDIEAGRAPRPRVLDPFAGGGAIPLEALRLGCETHASDYNPVAVLILKATLEYPQQFGQPVAQVDNLRHGLLDLKTERTVNPLLEAVKHWGNWVLEEARKELARLYPPDPDGSVPVGYLWARTIPCQNPACGAEIPLLRQFWLAKKDKKRVSLYFVAEHDERPAVRFRIVGNGYGPWPEGFDPEDGAVARAVATCPCCGAMVDDNTTRRLFQEGKAGQRMVAVVLIRAGRGGKVYRVAKAEDEAAYRRAAAALEAKRKQLVLEWGVNPIPDESIPTPCHEVDRLPMYGMPVWGDAFNSRQKLALIVFASKARQAHEQMLAEGAEPDFAKAVATYQALAVDRLASFATQMCRWKVGTERNIPIFSGRNALPMVLDYFEVNVLSEASTSWINCINVIISALPNLSQATQSSPVPFGEWEGKASVNVAQSSATTIPYPDGYFDAILTDPPYYDNVNYSVLSDFFYVWLKRTVGHLYPDLFSTPLTPKVNEIISDPHRHGGQTAAKRFFEENLKRAFQEMHRILKPEGVAVIVYAHKSTVGWETLINSLLDSSLVVTGAWPLHTEMEARLTAQESAALASSIYIVARKLARQPTGFYNEVREELRHHLDAKLHRLWEEGISGADFFIAAIGSAIEVFGKYERVIDYEGNPVRADRLLAEVRTIATDYAVRQILRQGGSEARPYGGEVSDLTRFYVLWRWEYGEAQAPFDEARKLAQSCGLDLAREWGRGGFVRKEREFIRVLGPQQRKLDELEEAHELIDVLHRVLLLWEKGRRADIVQALALSGYGRSEAFYRVAQAVSETLPNQSKEKKLLDGFLAGRERLREEVGKVGQQARLWE